MKANKNDGAEQVSSSNLLGVDEEIIQEEMEWIREVKLQNGFGHDTKFVVETKESDKVPDVNKAEPEKSCDSLAIQILERQISEKKSAMVEKSKEQEPCTIQNSSGLDESTFHEEMEWIREMKIQNGIVDSSSNHEHAPSDKARDEETLKHGNQMSSDALAIQKLENIINLKRSNSKQGAETEERLKKEHTDEFEKDTQVSQENYSTEIALNGHRNFPGLHKTDKINEIKPQLSNGHTNSLGLDESVFQEEMDWIREVKSQNSTSAYDKPETVSSPALKIDEKKIQNDEVNKIMDLERQISEKINKAKAEEAAKRKQEKEKEEQELLQRLQEEMDFAEEMRQIAEEENKKRMEEEERQKKAIEDAKLEEARRKKIQDEKDMISKLEQMVLQKLTNSKQ